MSEANAPVEAPLRPLRHLASPIHHQQFQDMDVVTIRADPRVAPLARRTLKDWPDRSLEPPLKLTPRNAEFCTLEMATDNSRNKTLDPSESCPIGVRRRADGRSVRHSSAILQTEETWRSPLGMARQSG